MQNKWWQSENRQLIKRYFKLFRPYRRANRPLVVRAALGLTITTLVSLVLPWVTMKAVDSIINTKEISQLVYLLMFWIAAILARALGNYLSFYNLMIFRQRMALDGKIKLLRHILRLPISYFNRVNIGYVVCRVRDDISSLNPFWAGTHLTVVQSILFVIASLILLFTISPKLTLVMLILSPIYLVHSFIFLKRIRDLSYETMELSGIAEGKLHESISGASTIKTLLLENYTIKEYFKRLKMPVKTMVKLEWFSHIKGNIANILTSFVPILISCYAGYLIYKGQLSVGEFIGFSVYVSFLLKPLSSLFDTNTQLQRALAPLQRVFEILDTRPESTYLLPRQVTAEGKITGDIEFRKVDFSYDGKMKALSEVSLSIKEKSVVGIAGISGAGKSTLVNLLVKLYDPDSGSIQIGNLDYRDISAAQIRRSIGIVSQDIFLFNATILENLACGRRTLSRDDIERAAKLAGAHEFIMAMENGYNTVVGVRGLKMSGGQRARLSIARAILRDPTILIFDEATAFMDSRTERFFREATEKLFRDRTIIVIAHRISSICDADQILVFDKGRVIQRGTHEELIDIPGLYRYLYTEQARLPFEAHTEATGALEGVVNQKK